MVAFNLWINKQIERQGREEADSSAGRTIVLAELRLGRAVNGLDELTATGVASCRPEQVDALRLAVLDNPTVREFSVYGPDGTSCNDVGTAPQPVDILSSQAIGPNLALEVVSTAKGRHRMVRIMRNGVNGSGAISALVSSELLITRLSNIGKPLDADVRISLRDGTTVVEFEATGPVDREAPERFVASRESERFGLQATIALPHTSDAVASSVLHSIRVVINGIAACLFFAVAFLVPWRRMEDAKSDIARALEAGEFVPYYQPIVDIKTGKLNGAEVLARWRKPDGTLVLPGAFVPLLESNGLIHELTRKLMRKVCDDLGSTMAQRPHLRVGFNLTAQHFADEAIVADARAIFEPSPIRLSQVVLELTERQPIENLTETRRVVAALQGLGFRIALDDVGTGHSGLSYMLKLGVDIIKIDKMFIDAIGIDSHSATIIETLVDLARNMRMEVIAEGIENFEQVMKLRELGIRTGQGYVFAPPLPISSYLQLVEAVDPHPAATVEDTESVASRYLPARPRLAAV